MAAPVEESPQQLRARIATLEQLLQVHERVTATQSKRLQQSVAEATQRAADLRRSEETLRSQSRILENVLRSMTDGLMVVDTEGTVTLSNPAAERMFGEVARRPMVDALAALRLPDQVTPCPADVLPIARALRGEVVDQVELFVRRADGSGSWVTVTASPMVTDGSIAGAVGVYRDTSEQRQMRETLEQRNVRLEDSERTNAELVDRLRLAIDDLSTPILEVWDDVLALPVVGVVDSRRAAQIMERLLDAVIRKEPRYVIIDVTGVEVIDSKTAEHFMKLVRAVELIGAQCMLTGIRAAVGQTLVDLGLDLGKARTLRTLKHALRETVGRVNSSGNGNGGSRGRGTARLLGGGGGNGGGGGGGTES